MSADGPSFIVADDHVLVRSGIVQLLREYSRTARVYEAANFTEALALADTHPECSLALIDLGMPGMSGFEALALFAKNAPTVPVVVLSASENAEDMRRALDSGALGYIPKSESASVILAALRLVLAGGVYVPPALLNAPRVKAPPAVTPPALLTPRQLEVLSLVIDGTSNKDIARALNLSEATVKAHLAAIFSVLNVNNRTQAARAAELRGLALPRLHRPE